MSKWQNDSNGEEISCYPHGNGGPGEGCEYKYRGVVQGESLWWKNKKYM